MEADLRLSELHTAKLSDSQEIFSKTFWFCRRGAKQSWNKYAPLRGYANSRLQAWCLARKEAVCSTDARRQATWWPAAIEASCGISVEQTASAMGQRSMKAQPGNTKAALGGSPRT